MSGKRIGMGAHAALSVQIELVVEASPHVEHEDLMLRARWPLVSRIKHGRLEQDGISGRDVQTNSHSQRPK